MTGGMTLLHDVPTRKALLLPGFILLMFMMGALNEALLLASARTAGRGQSAAGTPTFYRDVAADLAGALPTVSSRRRHCADAIRNVRADATFRGGDCSGGEKQVDAAVVCRSGHRALFQRSFAYDGTNRRACSLGRGRSACWESARCAAAAALGRELELFHSRT